MRDLHQAFPVSGRAHLDLLAGCVEDRVQHWQALPAKVHAALAIVRSLTADPARPEPLRVAACDVAAALVPYAAGDLSIDEVRRLRAQIRQFHARLRGMATCQELLDGLHATIEQHVELAAAGVERLEDSLSRAISELRGASVEAGPVLAAEIEATLARCGHQVVTPDRLAELALGLRRAAEALPPEQLARPRRRLPHVPARHFRIVVIDDEPIWQAFSLRAVDTLSDYLGPSFRIDQDRASSVEEALSLLLSGAPCTPGGDPPADERVQVIAIADVGLPLAVPSAHSTDVARTMPRRENGYAMLRELRSYRTNIPVVVLTTPPHLLEDQLRACALGIDDCDYVLKGPDKEERLVEAVLRVIERSQLHVVELRADPRPAARVDGVPVPVADMPFRTFYALCQLSQASRGVHTPEAILDQLDETFGDAYDYRSAPETAWERALVMARERSGTWWHPTWAVTVANVMRLWAGSKRDAAGVSAQALRRLISDNRRLCEKAVRLLEHYRKANPNRGPWARGEGWRNDRLDCLMEAFDYVFGGLELDSRRDYDVENIEKHVHEIRAAIHTAFGAVHRFIEPRREILEYCSYGARAGYRVLGEIVFHDTDLAEFPASQAEWSDQTEAGGGLTISSRCRVLVVENEEHYRQRMRTLLESGGYEVATATNTEDAVAEAMRLYPEILCLDLHIPATRAEFERDPASGDVMNGLRVLEVLRRASSHEVEPFSNLTDSHPAAPGLPRVVIPTTHYNEDILREQAARLGVPVTAFIPKGETAGGAPWEGHLLLTVARLREEIRLGTILPALPAWRMPVVELLPGASLDEGLLHARVNGRPFTMAKSKQARLLGLLLKTPGAEVSYADIDQFVAGGSVPENTRKQWLKNLRNKIAREWLGTLGGTRTRPECEVLETVKNGLVLHAHVIRTEATDAPTFAGPIADP